MTTKKNFGQFMTTNFQYIMTGLVVPSDVQYVIEPFCGNGDLIKFLGTTLDNLTNPIQEFSDLHSIECYDIEPRYPSVVLRDTIMNPPDYNNKYVITNPPFLARNKSKSKEAFEKYGTNDLFKCFLKGLVTNVCVGGIIIVPLNFWTSIRKSDIELRKEFLSVYVVSRINVFEERVFDDTSYTILIISISIGKWN